MKRRLAIALSALVLLIALPLCLLTGEDRAVIGRWEATAEVAQVAVMEVEFTFDEEGVYTCAIHTSLGDGFAQGHYKAKRGKLFLSDGMDYEIDAKVYDTYVLSGDTLTIQGGAGGELDGLFPLELKRSVE